MIFATAPAAPAYRHDFTTAERNACFAVNATACAYYEAATGPELAVTTAGAWLEFKLTVATTFKAAGKLAEPKLNASRSIAIVAPGIYSGFQARISQASYADRYKQFATQAEAVAYVADWVARRYTAVTPTDVTVVAPAATTPRQHIAAEIAAASLALMQAEQAGDLLAVELAENRVYRAGIAEVLTHVSHHGQRCAVLAIDYSQPETILTLSIDGQPVVLPAGLLTCGAAGLEFEAYEQPNAESVELAAAVAQQQRAQNATRVSDEVKQQLLNAAAKRLAKAQAAAAEAPTTGISNLPAILKASDYAGLTGVWIQGEGVVFSSILDAEKDQHRQNDPNGLYELTRTTHNGHNYWKKRRYNVFN